MKTKQVKNEKVKAKVKKVAEIPKVKEKEDVVKAETPKIEKPVEAVEVEKPVETPVEVVEAVESKIEEPEKLSFVDKMIFGFTPKQVQGNRTLHIQGEHKLEIIDGRIYNRGMLKAGWIVRLSSGRYLVTKVDDSGATLEGNAGAISARSEIEILNPDSKETRSLNVNEDGVEEKPTAAKEVIVAAKEEKLKTGQYNFNGKTLSKSFLAREIVAKYVQDNPKATIKDLEEKFPIPGMGKYGLFKEVNEAKKISGGGLPRYFFKPEQLIKVGKDEIAVCNQITEERINSIIEAAKAVGYTI